MKKQNFNLLFMLIFFIASVFSFGVFLYSIGVIDYKINIGGGDNEKTMESN